jgi:hypothetical protein
LIVIPINCAVKVPLGGFRGKELGLESKSDNLHVLLGSDFFTIMAFQ